MHIVINCLLCFADCLSHTPQAAVSDQSVGTAVGIVLCKLATEMGEETNDSTVALYKLILHQMKKFSLKHQMSMLPLNSKEYFQRLKSVVERQSPKVTFYYLLNVLNNFCLERLYASPFLNLDVRLRKQLWSSNVSGIELLILQFWS